MKPRTSDMAQVPVNHDAHSCDRYDVRYDLTDEEVKKLPPPQPGRKWVCIGWVNAVEDDEQEPWNHYF